MKLTAEPAASRRLEGRSELAPPAQVAPPKHPAGPAGLTTVLRERTAPLHREAERAGIVGAMIAGRATRSSYVLFLRNLLAAYRELEGALGHPRRSERMRALCPPELSRTAALESDLAHLWGRDWPSLVPLLPAGHAYAERIASTAAGDGSRLIAHAYTRYLGDLGGGQILKRRLGASLDLDTTCLSFYEFPDISNVAAFAQEYRGALEASSIGVVDLDAIADEAVLAFRLNIELSRAVQELASATAPPPSSR